MRALVRAAAAAVVFAFGMAFGTAFATPQATALIGAVGDSFDIARPDVQKAGWLGGLFGTRRTVDFPTKYRKGDIIIRTSEFRLYFVVERGKAYSYRIGVGREGYAWTGVSYVSRKAEWPGWTPPAAMRKREPHLPAYMPGGINNPLGARALYLGSTLFRIHGTRYRRTLGRAISSGCIRMLNDDVIELYNLVRIGARVYVYP